MAEKVDDLKFALQQITLQHARKVISELYDHYLKSDLRPPLSVDPMSVLDQIRSCIKSSEGLRMTFKITDGNADRDSDIVDPKGMVFGEAARSVKDPKPFDSVALVTEWHSLTGTYFTELFNQDKYLIKANPSQDWDQFCAGCLQSIKAEKSVWICKIRNNHGEVVEYHNLESIKAMSIMNKDNKQLYLLTLGANKHSDGRPGGVVRTIWLSADDLIIVRTKSVPQTVQYPGMTAHWEPEKSLEEPKPIGALFGLPVYTTDRLPLMGIAEPSNMRDQQKPKLECDCGSDKHYWPHSPWCSSLKEHSNG